MSPFVKAVLFYSNNKEANVKMVKEIKELYGLYGDKVLGAAADRYGFDKKKLKKLGSFESFVYESERENLILKVTHSIRRTKEYVMGEMEFVRFLAKNGVSVSKPIPSKSGALMEILTLDDGYFLMYAFKKVKGQEPGANELNADFYEKWGRLVGQIHALSKMFEPSHPSFRRQEWYEEQVLDFSRYIPSSQTIVHEKKEKLFKKLQALPQSKDSYGLTHNDIHYGNIFLNDGRLTVFDFDDCSYQWFANDIAIAVHSILPGYDQEAQFGAIVEHFMTHFIKGYLEENKIDNYWLRYVPDFLKLYDLINYGVFHQVWDMKNLGKARKRTLDRVRHRIENEICIVETDFEKFGE